VKIAPSALDHHRGIARATECPDKERRCVRQREDDFLRTKLHTRVFVAVFIGSLASKRSAVDSAPELNVTRNALRFRKIRPDDERELALVSGRPRPLMSTPRGHLRPDKMGRERPPSERARGHLPAVAEGVAHAPARVPPSSARSATAQCAAALSMPATAHRLVRQWFAVAPIVHDADRPRRRFVVHFSGLRGTTPPRGVVPPFVLHVPLRECAKLTLTLTVTRERAR
jgi:hypothetical protein